MFAFVAAAAIAAQPATTVDTVTAEPIDLSRFDETLAVPPTQMLNLGTTHFSGLRDRITREELDAALAPLMTRLEAWAPDTITIEGISGPDCDLLIEYAAIFPGAAESYCASAEKIAGYGEFVGMSRAEAAAKAMETFLAGGPDDTPQARRADAAVLMAAGNRDSALVQWLRLDEAERVAGDELSPEMVEDLTRHLSRHNESVSIGVELAARLGHDRVWHVDDHSADMLYLRNAETFGERMGEIWSSGDMSGRARYTELMQKLEQDRDLVALIAALNTPEAQEMTIRGDFAKGLADTDPRGVGQDYATWWQVRGLRMAANIVAAAGLNQSRRTLNIVGASHKGYYDAYLDMMHHVELVDTVEFLSP